MKRFEAPLLLVGPPSSLVSPSRRSAASRRSLRPAACLPRRRRKPDEAAYAQQCAGCHGAGFSRLRRRAIRSPGVDFRAKWGPRAVNELFTYLVQTMPPTNPGALGEQGTLNVTAYPAADQRRVRRRSRR